VEAGQSGERREFREPVHAGQIRSFRITGLDAAQKRIELELV